MTRDSTRMSEFYQKITEAKLRCDRQEAHEGIGAQPVLYYTWVSNMLAEQVHHGTTDYALAAFAQLYRKFRRRCQVVGVLDYKVPDMEGNRTILEPAIVVGDSSGPQLVLTGCSWGYGGEGPSGTAAILCWLGHFDRMQDALRFVGGLKGNQPWRAVED